MSVTSCTVAPVECAYRVPALNQMRLPSARPTRMYSSFPTTPLSMTTVSLFAKDAMPATSTNLSSAGESAVSAVLPPAVAVRT